MTVIRSFDIFDTAITRIYARPTDLFAVLAWAQASNMPNKIGVTGDWTNWQRLRTEAERSARLKTTNEDVTLEEIYTELIRIMGISSEQARNLMHLEIATEQQSVRGVPAVLSAIQIARNKGQRVIFISDMYLPERVLRDLLETCGAYRPGDRLYVSGEVGLTKASGNLFRHCLAQEGILPHQLHHWGDNKHTDIKRANVLGIQTTHFSATHLNRYEEMIADAAEIDLVQRSRLAGACRLTRLDCPYVDEHLRTIWDTASSVAGPILTGYVAWILAQASQQGIKRIYFVARDGQILWKVAQVLCRKLDFQIECRYLYGSRQAWHLPATTTLGSFEYSWIFAPTHFLSVRSFLQRVEITPGEIRSLLLEAGLTSEHWDDNLIAQEREKLFNIVRSGQLDDLILRNAEEARQKTLAYFAQEGLLDSVSYALVDLGWHGRLQRCASAILALGGGHRPLSGYYFGLMARIDPQPGDQLHAYCWDHGKPESGLTLGLATRVIMETFAAADHGGVRGYQVQGDKVLPALLRTANDPVLQWGLQAQQAAILCFAQELAPEICRSLADPAWVAVWLRTLDLFYATPTWAEASAYGQYPDSEDQNEASRHPLAEPYTLNDVQRLLRSGVLAHHHNEWRQAATVLTPGSTLLAIRIVDRIRSMIDRISS